MKLSQAFPSKYMNRDDLDGDVTLTIDSVDMEGLESDGVMSDKLVIHFRESHAKPFIVNKGNAITIADAHGDDTDNWVGKRVTIYVDQTVMFGGKRVGGIRVRIADDKRSVNAPAPRNTSSDQSVTAQIQRVQVTNGWYGITTSEGLFVTDDAAVGMEIQSFGNIRAKFTYYLTPGGKQVVTHASPVVEPPAEPAHKPVDDDDIPF